MEDKKHSSRTRFKNSTYAGYNNATDHNPRILAPLMTKNHQRSRHCGLQRSGVAKRATSYKLSWEAYHPLVSASWTGTIQSFVQAGHHSITDRPDSIPRAREYSIAYLIRSRSDVVLPFTPSPPFGETSMSNLSLETRTHLEHHHRPILYRTSCLLDTGEE